MTETTLTFSSLNIQETQALAATLAAACKTGDCVCLTGNLGAGKTTFARAFIHALQDTPEEVVSPTFTLAQHYPIRGGQVSHFDLYRLKHAGELEEIGLADALTQGITLIEWPQFAQKLLPVQALSLQLDFTADADRRAMAFSGESARWSRFFDTIRRKAA